MNQKGLFKVRSSEHMRAVKNGDTDKNEIADYCWKESHQMDWDNKKVIGRERNVSKDQRTIHSIKDNKHINSISYNLRRYLVP